MAFERIFGSRPVRESDEPGEYGGPLLDRVEYGKPVDTAGGLKAALSYLCDAKYPGREKIMVFSEVDGNGRAIRQLIPLDAENVGGRFVVLLARPEKPTLMKVDELRFALKGVPDGTAVEFQLDDSPMRISKMALDVFRASVDPTVLYIVSFGMQKAAGSAAKVKSVEAATIPAGTAGFAKECAGMAARAGRDIMGQALVFELPDDGFAGGAACTIDVVRRKGQHAEVELMSFERGGAEEMRILNDPGEFSVADACGRMKKLGPDDIPLFFMYRGRPYEIGEMRADAGRPVTCSLVPWGSLDESSRAKTGSEIELWAEWCREPVLSWEV